MKKICIVQSTWNSEITDKLCISAIEDFSKSGIKQIDTIKVPGSFEIPVAISRLVKKYDGFVAVGCIIKGETNNFDLISQSVTDALMYLSINHKKPIGNGIITCFNDKQANERRKKGAEAAAAVVNFFSGPTPFKLD